MDIPEVKIAIIGGTGVYDIEGLEILDEVNIDTPFGSTSDAIRIGRLGDRLVAFLPRHGRGHRISPSEIPQLANVWALKKLGVFWVISISAVGSLRLDIAPRDFVIPDQIIDRTRHRRDTFFSEGVVAHVNFAHPFHPDLRSILLEACRAEGIKTHDGGTYVCMEGPQFSTKAESEMHRQWGASLIGMTALPEAKLAREAEMCYATIALVTDYDVWNEDDHVDIAQIITILNDNVSAVKRTLSRVIQMIPLGSEDQCDASHALECAILTSTACIPEKAKRDLGILLSKYLG